MGKLGAKGWGLIPLGSAPHRAALLRLGACRGTRARSLFLPPGERPRLSSSRSSPWRAP